MKQKNWVKKGIILGIILVCAAVYFFVPPVKSGMNKVFSMFASGDFDVVREFVASYGGYAALVSFLLMIFQSVAAFRLSCLLWQMPIFLDGGRGLSFPGAALWQGQLCVSLLPVYWGGMLQKS